MADEVQSPGDGSTVKKRGRWEHFVSSEAQHTSDAQGDENCAQDDCVHVCNDAPGASSDQTSAEAHDAAPAPPVRELKRPRQSEADRASTPPPPCHADIDDTLWE